MIDDLATRRERSVAEALEIGRQFVIAQTVIGAAVDRTKRFLDRLSRDTDLVASLPGGAIRLVHALRAAVIAAENTRDRLSEHDLGETA